MLLCYVRFMSVDRSACEPAPRISRALEGHSRNESWTCPRGLPPQSPLLVVVLVLVVLVVRQEDSGGGGGSDVIIMIK